MLWGSMIYRSKEKGGRKGESGHHSQNQDIEDQDQVIKIKEGDETFAEAQTSITGL